MEILAFDQHGLTVATYVRSICLYEHQNGDELNPCFKIPNFVDFNNKIFVSLISITYDYDVLNMQDRDDNISPVAGKIWA